MTYLRREEGVKIIKLLIVGMCCFILLTLYVAYTNYEGRKTLVTSQRAGCERGKLDRIDNAAFQRAHKVYIDKVVLAQSVKEDVKEAAREAVVTYNRTAESLSQRAKINCQEAFPKASLLP